MLILQSFAEEEEDNEKRPNTSDFRDPLLLNGFFVCVWFGVSFALCMCPLSSFPGYIGMHLFDKDEILMRLTHTNTQQRHTHTYTHTLTSVCHDVTSGSHEMVGELCKF